MRVTALSFAAFALASCDGVGMTSEAAVHDIATEVATGVTEEPLADLQRRLDEQDAKISEMKARLDDLEAETSSLRVKSILGG